MDIFNTREWRQQIQINKDQRRLNALHQRTINALIKANQLLTRRLDALESVTRRKGDK